MRVFVTGATGYIGSAVVRALQAAGHEAHGLVRDEGKARGLVALGMKAVKGNLREPAGWAAAATGCDASIHTGMEYGPDVIAIDKKAIDGLLAAAREAHAPRSVVYTSGIWVLGATVVPADETAKTAPAALVAWRPAHEQSVLGGVSADVLTSVVRPGIVYGGKAGIVDGFFESAAKGEEVTFVGDGKNHWPTVHVDDLADLYVRLVENAARLPRAGRLFHATDGSEDTAETIARAASLAAGQGGKTKSWPLAEARAKLGPYADALALDQRVASPNAEKLLGWRPRMRDFTRNAARVFAERSHAV